MLDGAAVVSPMMAMSTIIWTTSSALGRFRLAPDDPAAAVGMARRGSSDSAPGVCAGGLSQHRNAAAPEKRCTHERLC